jgi:hypothetical protein
MIVRLVVIALALRVGGSFFELAVVSKIEGIVFQMCEKDQRCRLFL